MLNMKMIKRDQEGELLMEGRLDNASVADAQPILMDVVERYDSVVLNMKDLEYITSAGLRVLRNMILTMRKKGGKVVATNVNPMIQDVFRITGFFALIKIE